MANNREELISAWNREIEEFQRQKKIEIKRKYPGLDEYDVWERIGRAVDRKYSDLAEAIVLSGVCHRIEFPAAQLRGHASMDIN